MSSQQKRVLSLFSGCRGMDLGLEGDFWVHQDCVNENIHQDWIVERREPWLKLQRTTFETVFANDITKSAHNRNQKTHYLIFPKEAILKQNITEKLKDKPRLIYRV
jgi:site-specific DNA-cytosine methylase